jgi:hypothetical protein
VTPPDALPGIEVGVTRRDPTGVIAQALNPGEAVDLATLIEAYTLGGAWAMGHDDVTGSLEVGKAADLVVLERNLFSLAADEIGEVQVLENLGRRKAGLRGRCFRGIGFAPATVALAHLALLAHDDHRAPVLDEVVGLLASHELDQPGIERSPDRLVLFDDLAAIPV